MFATVGLCWFLSVLLVPRVQKVFLCVRVWSSAGKWFATLSLKEKVRGHACDLLLYTLQHCCLRSGNRGMASDGISLIMMRAILLSASHSVTSAPEHPPRGRNYVFIILLLLWNSSYFDLRCWQARACDSTSSRCCCEGVPREEIPTSAQHV